MIRAFVFDFGNVICHFEPRLFIEKIAGLTNTPLGTLQEAMQQSFDLGREYETGRISSDEFFNRICSRYSITVEKSAFIDAFTSIFTPIPSTYDLIRHLKPHYKLGLLSNTNEWHFQYGIQKVDVYPLFDAVTVSFHVGAMKPSRQIYDDMVTKLQVSPEECVYIDDLRENAEAGSWIGMHAIHYTSHDQLLAALRQFDIAV